MLGRTAALGLHARMNGSNSSGGGGANNQRLGAANSSRHSRSRSTDSLADLYLPLSPSELVERVWSQTCLYAGLALRLWSFLGLGWKWLLNASRLVLYALLLLPGFMQVCCVCAGTRLLCLAAVGLLSSLRC
jgi:prenylcysteine alpha-carboxyl methylesterase